MSKPVSKHWGRSQSPNRRAAVRQTRPTRNRATKLAMTCSFLFSAVVLAWAFNLSVRSLAKRPHETLEAASTSVSSDGREYIATLSADEYVRFVSSLDRQLLDRVQRAAVDRVPSADHARTHWQRRTKRRQQMLERMRAEAGASGFIRGTVQWQFEQELRSADQDAPLGV